MECKYFFPFLVFLLINCGTLKDEDLEKQKIEEVVSGFFTAVSEYNYTGIKGKCAEGFMLLEHGKIWNADSLINLIKPYERIAKFSYRFKDFKTTVEGSTAWIAYRNIGLMTTKDNRTEYEWLESAVLRRKNGEWKLALLHSTRIRLVAEY